MAVAYGSHLGNYALNTTLSTSVSPTGADTVIVLVANLSGGSSQTPSSVTYGGNAMTSLTSLAVGGNSKLWIYYYLAGTTSGSSTACVVNVSSSCNIFVDVQWYTGATTPTANTPSGGTNPGNSSSTGTFTATVASSSFTAWGTDQGTSITSTTPTADYLKNQDGSTSGNNFAATHNSGSASQTFSASYGGGDSWGIVCCEVPVAGGGGSGPVGYQLVRPTAIRRASGW